MSEKAYRKPEEIFSKVFRAGRRTYFFDVRETKAGDYYLTITESKKNINEDGTFSYKKHKIYLYKEDFGRFKELLDEVTGFIIDEKGEEVISERHQKDFKPSDAIEENATEQDETSEEKPSTSEFTDVDFDDFGD